MEHLKPEARLAAGLLSAATRIKRGVSYTDLLARALQSGSATVWLGHSAHRQLVEKAGSRLAESWLRLRGTKAGRDLISNARYEIRLKHPGLAREVGEWLPTTNVKPRGWYVSVESPAHTVEWKWPLRVAVMPDEGYEQAQAAMSALMTQGPWWAPQLLRWEQVPADRAGAADILIFPRGQVAIETLLASKAPVTADLLVLGEVSQSDFGAMAGKAEQLLALTQANAVLLADMASSDFGWLAAVIEHLSHDEPLDVAVAQAMEWPLQIAPTRMMLLATPRFIKQARLSGFVGCLADKLARMEGEIKVDIPPSSQWSGSRFGGRKTARRVGEMLAEEAPRFEFKSERGDASLVSAIAEATAKAAPPTPPAVSPRRAGKAPRPQAEVEQPERRFLQERIKALERTAVGPEKALEAGRKYSLAVRIGPKEKEWTSARKEFPFPAVTPDEAAVSLVVVFEEKNSVPEPQQRTILLPREGVSSVCAFEFTVSAVARLLEGWISVYHNNRLIQEARIRATVLGGSGELPPEGLPKRTQFDLGWMPRPLELGLRGRGVYAGTVRIDGEGVTVVGGFRTSRVTLPGTKEAVAAIESEFNRIDWEALPADWTSDESAVAAVRKVAQNGWQIYQALIQDPAARMIAESGDPVLVYATDSQVRMPLEFCYTRSQPKNTAKICPMSAESIENGKCVEPCMEKEHPGDYLCPFGFWGLTRVIEWRNRDSERRSLDGETVDLSNEPTVARGSLTPLSSVLLARSSRVKPKDVKGLKTVLKEKAGTTREARDWGQWDAVVKKQRPTLLVLLPHVEADRRPPLVEIGSKPKDPPGFEQQDVVGEPPQQPVVLLLGCGAAVSLVDFQNLPAQLRRQKAALVVAPVAELLATDAPEVARAIVEELAEAPRGEKPFGEVLLKAKRRLLGEGRLAGLLLLAFGDAEWRV